MQNIFSALPDSAVLCSSRRLLAAFFACAFSIHTVGVCNSASLKVTKEKVYNVNCRKGKMNAVDGACLTPVDVDYCLLLS
ncbi:hypothetical protein K435DRAFT_150314 [Dendrothele bispora CBS 962.96]|uniref:Uncharacterized protein n=1 Tax=Dendrothele bispora (strain CBS 962.96) TaxID=1314807 RepID=A0A4S8MPY8_DENBC|nr:hypothetical protein K435DRAFT_150314 [Dendrothele bispora CBS 962.96]